MPQEAEENSKTRCPRGRKFYPNASRDFLHKDRLNGEVNSVKNMLLATKAASKYLGEKLKRWSRGRAKGEGCPTGDEAVDGEAKHRWHTYTAAKMHQTRCWKCRENSTAGRFDEGTKWREAEERPTKGGTEGAENTLKKCSPAEKTHCLQCCPATETRLNRCCRPQKMAPNKGDGNLNTHFVTMACLPSSKSCSILFNGAQLRMHGYYPITIQCITIIKWLLITCKRRSDMGNNCSFLLFSAATKGGWKWAGTGNTGPRQRQQRIKYIEGINPWLSPNRKHRLRCIFIKLPKITSLKTIILLVEGT